MVIFQQCCEGKKINQSCLPHNYRNNTVAYISNHDSPTLIGWFNTLNLTQKKYVMDYFNIKNKDEEFTKIAKKIFQSNANLLIFQLQDVLLLDNSSRVNMPGVYDNKNWSWKLNVKQFNSLDQSLLKDIIS